MRYVRPTSTTSTAKPSSRARSANGPVAGDDEGDDVAAVARAARELQRDELAARDLAADHEVDDPHGRQTATSSVASSTPSREITTPSERDGVHRRRPGDELRRASQERQAAAKAEHVESLERAVPSPSATRRCP